MINMIGLIEKFGPGMLCATILVVLLILYYHFIVKPNIDFKTENTDDDEDINFYEDDETADIISEKPEEVIDMMLIRNRLYVIIQELFDLNRYDDGKCIICYKDSELQDWFHITTVLFQNDLLYVKIDYAQDTPLRSKMERACYIRLHHDTEQAELFRNETNYSVYGNEIKSTDIQLCNALFEISVVGVTEDYGY